MEKRFALIIEDDLEFAKYVAVALAAMNFETELIDNGGKALARLTEVVPHLVILDMHLPVYSGDNVLRQIYADRNLIDTRVIIITADSRVKNEYVGKADRVLTKPIELHTFQQVVRDMFYISD